MPTIRFEAPRAILGERDVGAGGQGDVVVVVETGQLSQLQMAGQRSRLRGHALHEITVADDRVGGVIDHLESGPVVARRQLRLGDRHPYRVGESLPQRSRGGLHAGRMSALRMPRRLASELAKLFDVVER